MRTPTVHINGSNRKELENKYEQAYRALNLAIIKLGEANPNGRDYYPQGPDAINEASTEHTHRIKRLRSVADELTALYNSVAE